MSDDTLFSYFKALPTPDDLERWEEEYARMGAAIKELTQKRTQLGKLIEVAAAIHGGQEAKRRGIGNANLHSAREPKKGTWMSAIAEIAKAHPDGISYDDVRRALPEPYASRIQKDPHAKSFFGAMRRLEEGRVVKRYRAHLFTPDGFTLHKERVAKGEIPDVQGHDARTSPMADALKAFLGANPRTSATVINRHLTSLPEFRTGMLRNASAIYNVLRRLKDRDEIVHHEDGTYSLPADGGETSGHSDLPGNVTLFEARRRQSDV